MFDPNKSQGAKDYYAVMLFFDLLCFLTIVFGVNSFGVSKCILCVYSLVPRPLPHFENVGVAWGRRYIMYITHTNILDCILYLRITIDNLGILIKHKKLILGSALYTKLLVGRVAMDFMDMRLFGVGVLCILMLVHTDVCRLVSRPGQLQI